MECKLCIRKTIKKKWYFDCICTRCQSPDDLGTFISSPKCQECQKGYLVPEFPLDHSSDWICQNCPKKRTVNDIHEMESNAKRLVQDMEKASKP